MLILIIVIFLEYVLVLLFRRSYLSSFCCYICECARRSIANHRKCWGSRSLSLQTKLGNKRHRLRSRLCYRSYHNQSNPHVIAKNINVNHFQFPLHHLWLFRVYSYLRQILRLLTQQSDLLKNVGNRIRKRGRLITSTRPRLSPDKRQYKSSSLSGTSKDRQQSTTLFDISLLQSPFLSSSIPKERSYNLSIINTILTLPTISSSNSDDDDKRTFPLTPPDD